MNRCEIGLSDKTHQKHEKVFFFIFSMKVKLLSIPVNLSDSHGRRYPAIENEKAGGLARLLF